MLGLCTSDQAGGVHGPRCGHHLGPGARPVGAGLRLLHHPRGRQGPCEALQPLPAAPGVRLRRTPQGALCVGTRGWVGTLWGPARHLPPKSRRPHPSLDSTATSRPPGLRSLPAGPVTSSPCPSRPFSLARCAAEPQAALRPFPPVPLPAWPFGAAKTRSQPGHPHPSRAVHTDPTVLSHVCNTQTRTRSCTHALTHAPYMRTHHTDTKHTCMLTRMHAHTHVRTFTCMHSHTDILTCIHTCVQAHMQTGSHTCAHVLHVCR